MVFVFCFLYLSLKYGLRITYEMSQKTHSRNHIFTVSSRAQENMELAVNDGNTAVSFMASEGYIRFKADMEVSTKELYAVYKLWCEDNSLHPLSERSFSAFLHENEDTYNLEATNNVYIGNGRRVRGFVGIELLQNHHPY